MRRVELIPIALCALSVLSALPACESGGQRAVRRSPLERALERSQTGVQTGVREGLEEADGLPAYALRLRHNPGRCEAPEFEVFVRGRWTRAFLDIQSEEATQRVQAYRARARSSALLLPMRVAGRPGADSRLDARGVRWPIVIISGLEVPAVKQPRLRLPGLTRRWGSRTALRAPRPGDRPDRPRSGGSDRCPSR